jgi:hypothetical protein
MLKNIVICGLALGAALFFVSTAALAGTTQIIAQWRDTERTISPLELLRLQTTFDERAQQKGYDSDGNDVGSGTTNFYFYADDKQVNSVVQDLIAMRTQNLVPDGMRIGVAVYKNEKRDDWTYRAVYPPSLKNFDITYKK